MSYFAKISGSNNVVVNVIAARQNFIDSGVVGTGSQWIKTDKNTRGNVHYGYVSGSYAPDSGTPFRKNFASMWGVYDETRDAFYVVQPEPSGSIPYVLNEDSCLWELSGSGS